MGVTVAKPRKHPGVYQQKSDENQEDRRRSVMNMPDTTMVTVAIRDVKTQIAISNGIDKSLQKEKTDDMSRVKILLLGGADAGKSTILKQMRILHMTGFSDEEMHSFHKYLRYNVFQIFHEIALGVQECILNIAESEKNLIYRFSEGLGWFMGFDEKQEVELLINFIELKCVRSFMESYPNYSSLPDNAHYYIPNLAAILAPSYMPTPVDILHLRIPTTSVNEINFKFATSSIRLIDVGGQRTYRKKWIHCFDGVSAVLFVASMAAYDQSLDEVDMMIKPVLHTDVLPPVEIKPAKLPNRLRDSAQLFGEMLRSKYLTKAAFILFMNKANQAIDFVLMTKPFQKDLFFKKLKSHPLSNYISGYSGKSGDEASEFLKEYFLKRKSKKDKERKIYSHYTCATDTKNVEFVFKAACDIVLQKNLNSSGIQ